LKGLFNASTPINNSHVSCYSVCSKSYNIIGVIKALGVLWMVSDDNFTFDSKLGSCEERFMKRTFLKKIATLFDPLGFLSPFTVRAKVLMQEIWIAGVE